MDVRETRETWGCGHDINTTCLSRPFALVEIVRIDALGINRLPILATTGQQEDRQDSDQEI